MKKNALSRRELLHHGVQLAVIASTPILLNACSKKEIVCEDTSGLKEADAQLRISLEYQERSPHGDTKNCTNCQFFKPGGKEQCGSCTLLKGPIHPLGYCNSWAPKG